MDGNQGQSSRNTHVIFFSIIAAALVILLAALWKFSPLSRYADPAYLQEIGIHITGRWWAGFLVISVYILANSLLFPNMVLNIAVILGFGGFSGWVYAIAGSLSAASIAFFMGRHHGSERLAHYQGHRMGRIKQFLHRGGIYSVIAVRVLPSVPYTVLNAAMGSFGIRYRNFLIGTFIAHLPGTLTLAILGKQLQELISAPTRENMLFFAGILLAGGVLIFGFKRVMRHLMQKRRC
ncbi:MAG: TVP38/TMEM64 family protein [Candidatus Omnitrophota bacterium]